jgi:LDH2 family malate/lactate/ureidoglycolate dehydrogenase
MGKIQVERNHLSITLLGGNKHLGKVVSRKAMSVGIDGARSFLQL